MKNAAYKTIVAEIVKDIYEGKLNSNDKLPSGKQLQIKYNVSRAVTNQAFQKLLELDLAYSKQQQGFYVAEYFSGIVRPLHMRFNFDEVKSYDEGDFSGVAKYLDENDNPKKYTFSKREFFKSGKKIIISESLTKPGISVDKTVSITDNYLKSGHLQNVIREVRFEKNSAFGNKFQLVEIVKYFGTDEFLAISRNIIDHEIYALTKKEIVY